MTVDQVEVKPGQIWRNRDSACCRVAYVIGDKAVVVPWNEEEGRDIGLRRTQVRLERMTAWERVK